MDPTRLMTLPCTITHVTQDGTPDDYGNPTEETETETSICWYEQNRRREDTDLTHQQAETWSAYFPPSLTLGGADRVTILGTSYEFSGPPWPAYNPRLRRVTHIEATLERVV